MAISQYRGSPFAFQGSSRRGVVNMPGFSKRAWFDDVERNVRNLYDCENLEHDINVCRLGSELPAHYEVSVDGEVVDAPELVAGTGITINVADSNITINAVNNGDVTGPGTATGDNLTAFDGTTGKIIKDSGIAMADVEDLLDGLVPTRQSDESTVSVVASDRNIYLDTGSNAITLEMPGADEVGRTIVVANIGGGGANNVTVARAGSDTINGAASDVTLTPGESAEFVVMASTAWWMHKYA